MKNVCVLVVAGLALAVAVTVGQAPPEPWPQTINKVKDGLFVIPGFGGPSGGAIAVRETGEGLIVVDNKYPQDFANILQAIRSVTKQPVKYVLNTHQHGDHTGGNAEFLKTAEIIAHRNARANMLQLKQPGLPRIVFNDQQSVFLGGVEVQMSYLGRGHTNGDVVINFPDLRTIHTGDLVVGWGMRPDGKGGSAPLAPTIAYANGASVIEWVTTLDNILKLDFDTAIIGHGPVVKKDEIREFRGKMNTLRQRMSDAVKSGVKKEEIAGKIKLDDLWALQPPILAQVYDEIAASGGGR